MKVETLETTLRNAMKSIKELDKGLAFLYSKVKELKKLEKDWYGIEEDPQGAEDTRQVLIDFLQSKLGIKDASDIEFQRVHRIGHFNQQASIPQQTIARFLCN